MQTSPNSLPHWLKTASRLLNDQRLKYAWLMGGILWAAWLISILLGKANYDLAGQPLGGDYVDFHVAGMTLNRGESARLYDFDYQKQLQIQVLGGDFRDPTAYNALITPPHFSVPFMPLALLPYPLSFALWSLLGLALTYLSVNISGIENPRRAFLWSLTWFPLFAAVSFGQNSLASLALFSATYAIWKREDQPSLFAAGLVASLLAYKPQLTFGLGLLWLFNYKRDWPALLGLALGGGIQAGLSFWLMPKASLDYLYLTQNILPTLLQQPGYPIWHSHNWRAFWLLLMPGLPGLAEGISTLLALIGVWGFFTFNRRFQSAPRLRFAAMILLTLWISPHFLIYDWSILILPTLLLWQTFPDQRRVLKTLFALPWLAIFISGSLTYLQLQILPVALQISMPVLTLVIYRLWKMTSKSGF